MESSTRRQLVILLLLALVGGGLWWHKLQELPPELPAREAPPVVPGPGDAPSELAKKPLRVLFIGNSYTFVNDLPGMLRHLAAAGGNPLRFEGVMECPGGAFLRGHWASGEAQKLLQSSHFDWMVLQDQSQMPSFAREQLETDMYPFVANFHKAAEQTKTKTLLYMTWARQAGDPDNVKGDTFEAMQARVVAGYEGIAGKLNVPIAPVGLAWARAQRQQPALKLFQPDGSHPTEAGTYLAACVFYQMFYEKSPVGNTYHAGLSESEALILQKIAAETMAETRLAK